MSVARGEVLDFGRGRTFLGCRRGSSGTGLLAIASKVPLLGALETASFSEVFLLFGVCNHLAHCGTSVHGVGVVHGLVSWISRLLPLSSLVLASPIELSARGITLTLSIARIVLPRGTGSVSEALFHEPDHLLFLRRFYPFSIGFRPIQVNASFSDLW